MTSDPDIMLALLARFGMSEATPPQDEQVVEVVSQLSRMASEGPVSVDVGTLVHTLASLVRLDPYMLSKVSLTLCRIRA